MTSVDKGAPDCEEALGVEIRGRKEKRKALKKHKRKEIRKKLAISQREEEEALANDPEEQLRILLKEREEREAAERERKAFEERERLWLLAVEENRRKTLLEASNEEQKQITDELDEDDGCDYAEEGPAEIIWKGNEIIVKKKRIRIPRQSNCETSIPVSQEEDRPTSNPFPPSVSTQETLDSVAQQVPNFGTEQDKAHCPFHLKTGACRFGARCSRVHFYPDKSSTLLIKNMYTGPGFSWDHDEGLEFTEEEVERSYEEFYEDVHTEFLKFGELVNFKVCRNSSSHLRGNVYVHYKDLQSSVLAYNALNGRYYAGKQITCEFVNISKWKIAICGEYINSRLKNCSRGSACNFIHCFHNPGGDYEWADWDKPPPKYWMRKMAVLFGTHHDKKHDDVFDRHNRRSSQPNGSPSSSSSEDDSIRNRNSEGRRRRSHFLSKWDPSSESSLSHGEDDKRRPNRHSVVSNGDVSRREKERASHSRRVKGKVEKNKSDDQGGKIKVDRKRRRCLSEKRCEDGDHGGKHKLDVVHNQSQIFHDRYQAH